jgi:microcystin-dependent protein
MKKLLATLLLAFALPGLAQTKLSIYDMAKGIGAGGTAAKGDVFVVSDTNGTIVRVAAAAGVLTEDGSGNVSFAAPAVQMPTGAILPYGAASAPSGFLLCDGSVYAQATYPALYAIIGTTFGSGGAGNFTVPDLRQRFPLGKAASGTGSTLGGTGGNIDHTHGLGGSHTHDVVQAAFNTGTPSSQESVAGASAGAAAHLHTHSVSPPTVTSNTASAGSTSSANPPWQAVQYIIKT